MSRKMDNVVVRAGREYEITDRRLFNWDGPKPCGRRNASNSVLSHWSSHVRICS